MTHEAKVAQWIGAGKWGAEIGAGASPVPGLDPPPIYIDCFKEFGAAPTRADFYGHAGELPFHDHSLDYVIASHVLEHVANPIAALAEWYRVVRPGGVIYFVVPNRLAAFDHPRELTTVAHLINDYVTGATAHDATHIDEFAFGVDWPKYRPESPGEDIPEQRQEFARGMHEAVQRGEDINIHFHTFEPSTLRELLETLARWPNREWFRLAGKSAPSDGGPGGPALPPIQLNWEIVDFEDGFPARSPNGVLAILRVHKGWRARADAEAFRLRAGDNPRAVLREDAKPFAQWSSAGGGVR